MLTGELIRTKTVKKQIVPSFISTTSARHVARAEELVALMSRALESGWTRGQLGQAITEICSVDVDHRVSVSSFVSAASSCAAVRRMAAVFVSVLLLIATAVCEHDFVMCRSASNGRGVCLCASLDCDTSV